MSSGTAYQQQPSAPLTDVIESSPSPLLPTPTAQDGSNVAGPSQFERKSPPLNAIVRLLPTPTSDQRGPASRRGANAQGGPGLNETVKLLPTPAAGMHNYEESVESFTLRQEALKAKGINGNGAGMPLPIALKLLPTPTTADSRNSRNATANGGEGSTGHSGTTLSDLVYEWSEESQSSGESSSPPSDAGNASKDLRLSPWFVEWMMGAPEGWSDPDCPPSATAFASSSGRSQAPTSSTSSRSE